jgi:hypothetical protein
MGMAGSPTPGLMQQAQQAQAMGAGASTFSCRRATGDGRRTTAARRGTHKGRQPELRNAAPRYVDVTGCSLPNEPGEAGWPALTVGWHAECSPRTTFLVGRRVGRMCAVGCGRVHGVLCGLLNWVQHSCSRLSTSRLSTSRLCGAQRAHTGQQPAATSQPVDLQSHPQNAAHRLRAAPGPDCARNIRLGLPMAYAARTKNPRPAAESGYVERMSTCRSRSLGRFPRNPRSWRHVGRHALPAY